MSCLHMHLELFLLILLWIKRRMKMVPLPVAREVVIPAEAVIWMKIRWGKL